MSDLRFEIEWEPADGVQAPELASTWARMEIWVGDQCVTQVEDIDTRSSRRSVYAPVYPLAEWIAYNWWLLRANVRPAAFPGSTFRRLGSPRLRPWFRAHNVRSAGDGYVWPNLTVLPEGPATRLVWHADETPLSRAPIRYIAGGEHWVDSFGVESAFADVVEAVVTRLDEQGVADVPLQEEWAAVLGADSEETEFCLAVARLGLDPYAVDPVVKEALLAAATTLDARLLREFLEGVSPAGIDDGIRWLIRSADAIEKNPASPNDYLLALREHFIARTTTVAALPWERGWQEARSARGFLGLDDASRFETTGTFRMLKRNIADPSLQALGGFASDGGGALVVGRALRVPDSRFAQARALWHALGPSLPQRFLLTASPGYQPRVERAFAAELLAPAAGIRSVLNGAADTVVTTPDIEKAASHFGVNPLVIRHQAENQLDLPVAA